MKMYLIDGVSGAGKTTICDELNKRGYTAIEADEVLGGFVDPITGVKADYISENWHWTQEKFDAMIEGSKGKDIFVCGGAMNKPDYLHHFDRIFTLNLDDETLKKRLAERTNNDYGKKPEELAFQLRENELTAGYAKEHGAILIDATQPVEKVVSEILSQI